MERDIEGFYTHRSEGCEILMRERAILSSVLKVG
jgi:hypothetical protein